MLLGELFEVILGLHATYLLIFKVVTACKLLAIVRRLPTWLSSLPGESSGLIR
jgi:hypothetical protein